MKKTLLLVSILFIASRIFAQNLTITYDATKGVSTLQGSASCYMHSGGDDVIEPVADATTWKYVVGNWGMDDGIGKMTSIGTDLWQLDMGDAVAYYSQATNGPVTGPAIYEIGTVFRDAAGVNKGGDVAGNNIYINLSSGTPVITNDDGVTPFDGVTVAVSTGIANVNATNFAVTTYPNPVSSTAMFAYTLTSASKNITLTVYNSVGQVISRFNSTNLGAGTYLIHFDATNMAVGVYNCSLNVDGKIANSKFIVAK